MKHGVVRDRSAPRTVAKRPSRRSARLADVAWTLALLVAWAGTGRTASAQIEMRPDPARTLLRDPTGRDTLGVDRQNDRAANDPVREILRLDPLELGYGQLQPPGSPTRNAVPLFQGFPTFPPSVPGYGGYPGEGLPVPFTADAETPPVARRAPARLDDAWPSWFGASGIPEDEGFSAEVALLHRGSDRVWFLEPGGEAFVPLAFYDKFRVLTDGSRVEVRHKGEFQVTFQGGGTVRSRQPCRLAVDTLNQDVVAVGLPRLTEVWIIASARPYRVTLPDGSTLLLEDTEVHVQRRRDLLSITHGGTGTAQLQSVIRRVEIPSAHGILVPLRATERPVVPATLRLDGDLDVQRRGAEISIRAGSDGGRVVWSGARLVVRAGARVRLDPLGGSDFPENRGNQGMTDER